SRSCGDDKAGRTWAEQRECFYCKQEGHWIKECPKKLTMECFNCGQLGHTAKRCPKSSKPIESVAANLVAHTFTSDQEGSADKWTFEAEIEGKEVELLVDTGSKTSHLPEEKFPVE